MAVIRTWAWSLNHGSPCRIIERQELWDGPVYQVWVPSLDAVVPLNEDQVSFDLPAPAPGPAWLTYLAAAARVADALCGDLLLAPPNRPSSPSRTNFGPSCGPSTVNRPGFCRPTRPAWRRSMARQATTVPELDSILMVRVEGGRPHG